MGFLNLCLSLIFVLIIYESTARETKPHPDAIRCYSCNNVDSNSKCRRLVRCMRVSDGCENVVRMENGQLRISKGCQQPRSCRASSSQNRVQCSPSVQSILRRKDVQRVSRNLPPSVCRSCCNTERCNAALFLREASGISVGLPGTQRWRPTQPSIRDIKTTVLNSDSALITFIDKRNHSVSFFTIRTIPYSATTVVTPVFVRPNSIPGIKLDIPKGALAYLVTGLFAGRQHRISVVSRQRSIYYSQKIYSLFITKPRPPQRIRVERTNVHSVTLQVTQPSQKRGDVYSTFAFSYRRKTDPPSLAKRISNYNRPVVKTLTNLEPATEYVITAWTNVVDARGRLLGTSKKINTTVFTDVPGILSVDVDEVHATSVTWNIRVPSYVTRRSQQQFLLQVRDDTNSKIIVDTVVSARMRSYTATRLTPQTGYSLSVTARANNRESKTSRSTPVFTLVRCYSCLDANSRGQCDQYIECPADSGGCLNEVRRRFFTNANDRGFYRATLKCKQVRACNNSELQDQTEQCNPNRDRNVDPPDVCRCCCEGDLCNGAGGNCGHILGWLGTFRTPRQPVTVAPPLCPDPRISFGIASCENGREVGSVCTFRCIGDRYLVGNARVSCFDNGRWSARLPTCVPTKSCRPMPQLEGTTYNCTNGVRTGSVCKAKCKKGYLIAGEPAIRCLASGTWSQRFIPTCLSENNCQPNPCLNGATCNDAADDFECDCVLGWTGKRCGEEVVCERLVQPDNGKLQCTDGNRYLSRCRYSCDTGYEQHGSTYTRCLSDGYWSSFEPTICVIKTCPVPPLRLVNDGKTECTGFGIGDTCQFSCPRGLNVAGGPKNITCQANETWSGNVPCCDLQCPPHAKVDLYFLLDSSSSVGAANWKLLINFTIALLDQFVVGPGDMVVGIGRYNRRFDTRREIAFGDYKSYDDLKRQISRIPYNGRGTRTEKALRHVGEVSLNAPGNRADVPDILVVITDGQAQDTPGRAAALIRENKDIKIFAVGVRNRYNGLNREELLSIASGPEYMHIMDNGYEQLAQEFGATLAREVCWVPCQFQYERREVFLRQRQLAAMTGDELDAEFWSQLDANNGTLPSLNTTTIQPLLEVDTTRPLIAIEPEVNTPQRREIEEES